MAGINVPQYEIFKIGTDKLKYHGWNLRITKKEAFQYQESVALFEGQEFRIMADRILKKPAKDIDFSEIFLQVVVESKKDFARAAGPEGVTVNGVNYRRFVGTTGGLKNNTLLFCNSLYIEELNRLCECGRNLSLPLVPAKYEAYKALTCSASQPICSPRGILVVRDCVTEYFGDVITLDDSGSSRRPAMESVPHKKLQNTVSDGFNLCTVEYMERVAQSLGLDYTPGGVCLRNAWLKGMLYPFPILEFVREYNGGNYTVEDIWGHPRDLRDCEMILTESSLKLWMAYDSLESYQSACDECGYGFSVTKVSPKVLEEQRELNYQYLQSYDFTDEDIEELCAPTVRYLKDALCGDYDSTVKFLGITERSETNSWQRALFANEYMLQDPYVIDSVHRFLKKKMDDAKIGKLFVRGNYQIASGDPFALMQSVCGLKVTGLLSAGQCYSQFWADRGEKELIVFRSPMTSHNNIRRCALEPSEDCRRWYRYMETIMIINAWDTFCIAENGCDWDSDILFSTDNAVLRRRYRELPAIECVQRNAPKKVVTEEEIIRTNRNGMGNQVGVITNYVTSMLEVQSHFEKDSDEYRELEYRIGCGQLYQQNELDKIKGIQARSMPDSWYSLKACGDDRRLQSLCAFRKPYFMIYVYDDVKRDYNKYQKESDNKCRVLYGRSLEELCAHRESLSHREEEFLFWYEHNLPVGTGNCSMNRICRHVEGELNGLKSRLRQSSAFDYTVLKVDRKGSERHRRQLEELERYYCECVSAYKKCKNVDKENSSKNRLHLYRTFHREAKRLCPNDDERLNVILDIAYLSKGNRQFLWDTVGDLICKRLEEHKNVSVK